MKNENWVPIPGWELLYQISDLGVVRSMPRVKVMHNGGLRVYAGKLMYGTPDSNGYKVVTLNDATTGRHKTYKIHSLVLLAFVGEKPIGFHGCHSNDNKQDNRLINLRWDTPKGNCADKIRNGNSNKGELNPNAKLTVDAVYEIRTSVGLNREIAACFGVTPECVSNIKLRKSWCHV